MSTCVHTHTHRPPCSGSVQACGWFAGSVFPNPCYYHPGPSEHAPPRPTPPRGTGAPNTGPTELMPQRPHGLPHLVGHPQEAKPPPNSHSCSVPLPGMLLLPGIPLPILCSQWPVLFRARPKHCLLHEAFLMPDLLACRGPQAPDMQTRRVPEMSSVGE